MPFTDKLIDNMEKYLESKTWNMLCCILIGLIFVYISLAFYEGLSETANYLR